MPVRVVEYQKNGTLTETYGYDALGSYTSKTVGDGTRSFQVSRTFDSLGNLRTLTYPAGPGRASQTAAWQYDSFLRPVVVKFDGKDRAHMVYDPGTGSKSADSLIVIVQPPANFQA